jgi:SAM-dependent methyltransferase
MDLTEVPGAPFRRHPWEVARARFFRRVLTDAGLLGRPRAVLDVGSGDGYLARTLLDGMPAGSSVLCLDANYSAEDLRRFADPPRAGLGFARERPGDAFDLLLLLDVIEHVPDDRAFLRELLAANLGAGGAVLVSVPAWPALFSSHDEALKHYRRYTPAACRAVLGEVGLRVTRSGGVFHSLLAPRLLAVTGERLRRRLGGKPPPPTNLGQWEGGRAVSAVVERALALDNGLSRLAARVGGSLPGLSFWALCERTASA